jgi:hypothetical protein
VPTEIAKIATVTRRFTWYSRTAWCSIRQNSSRFLAEGADPSIRNQAGKTALNEAEEQVGRYAEAYFPARPIAPQKLDETITILRAKTTG